MKTKITQRLIPFASDEEAIAYARRHIFELIKKDPTKNYTTTVILSNGTPFTVFANLVVRPTYYA